MQSFEVNYGLAVLDPRPSVRIVMPARRQGKTLMARAGSLADRIKRGELRSAWDDYETETDAFMGRKSTDKVAENERLKAEAERYAQERRDAELRQEAMLEKARIAEAEAKARETQNELEALDGFGSF